MSNLREELVNIALKWQKTFGVSPSITSSISEYDAAIKIVKISEEDYSKIMQDRTAVSKGSDFEYMGKRYQVKANRPSGKKGSKVTLVPKASNYDWDFLIWILYDTNYEIQEAYQFEVSEYKKLFDGKKRLSPSDYRSGEKLSF